MKPTTARNHVDRIVGRIGAFYRCAVAYDQPLGSHLWSQVAAIYREDEAWHRLPLWARAEVHSYIRQLHRDVRDHTTTLYTLADGRRVVPIGSWDVMTEDERQQFRQGRQNPPVTYWLHTIRTEEQDGTITVIKRPTDKVYFRSP